MIFYYIIGRKVVQNKINAKDNNELRIQLGSPWGSGKDNKFLSNNLKQNRFTEYA